VEEEQTGLSEQQSGLHQPPGWPAPAVTSKIQKRCHSADDDEQQDDNATNGRQQSGYSQQHEILRCVVPDWPWAPQPVSVGCLAAREMILLSCT
jgi:hypothetical protein